MGNTNFTLQARPSKSMNGYSKMYKIGEKGPCTTFKGGKCIVVKQNVSKKNGYQYSVYGKGNPSNKS